MYQKEKALIKEHKHNFVCFGRVFAFQFTFHEVITVKYSQNSRPN